MIRQVLTSWAGLAAVVGMFGVALAGACSADQRHHTFDDDDGDSSGSSTNSGGVGGAFTTGSNTGTGVGGAFTGGAGGGEACASDSVKAEAIPLDLYIMLDQSGSMGDAAGSGTKWDAVSQALETFVQQPGTDGIGVGIQYFGQPPGGGGVCGTDCMVDADCGMCGPCIPFPIPGFPGICAGSAGGDSCDPVDYKKPDVEIAPLPGVANSIIQSIQAHSPSTGTPTHPALDGAIQHAEEWLAANLDHAVVVVFATDGIPSGCNENLADIDALAAAGLTNGILTFVIGVGDQLSALNGIAAAGGTMQAFLVDANANANQEFLDAMNAIRGTALACAYKIPVPKSGIPDYDAVNVQYTPGGGGMAKVFPKVDGKQACPPGGDAWYYDNNKAPTQIIMCDDTCTKLKMDDKGQIDILLGCATIVN